MNKTPNLYRKKRIVSFFMYGIVWGKNITLEIIKSIGVEPGECIFVGDSNVDALTAKNAKMPFVYVSWGYKNIDEMKEYDIDYIINKPMELINILKEINKDE